MRLEFNKEKLQKLLEDFYNCTKLSISVFNSDYECIAFSDSPHDYCIKLRKIGHLDNYCKLSDEQHFLEAKETKKTVIYTCHAGIVESITPIFYENVAIAYIFLGKFRDAERVYSSKAKVNRILKNYNLEMDDYADLYKLLPCLSKKEFDSALSILKTCIRYIWSENLFKLNKNMLPTQIENYIVENLKAELSVDSICQHFYISRKTLYAIFKEEFNNSVKNFVNNKRFQAAENLLVETQLPVSVIADKVGFSDYNYFIRQFKKKKGLTPLQFRHSMT